MHSSPIDFVLRTLESATSVITGETPIASALDFAARVLEGVFALMLGEFLSLLQLDPPPYYSLVANSVFLDHVLYDAVMFTLDYMNITMSGAIVVLALMTYYTRRRRLRAATSGEAASHA